MVYGARRQEEIVQSGVGRRCRWVVMALLAFVWACEGRPSGPVVDSESHWLERCETAATCGGALECVCGVCTVPCDGPGGCGSVVSGMVCAPEPDRCPIFAGGLCTARCAVDGDCVREHLACVAGACMPIASALPDLGPDMSPPQDMTPGPAPADLGPSGDMEPSADMGMPDMSPEGDAMAPDMAADMALPGDMAPPDMAPAADMAPPVEGECAHPDSTCVDDAQCAPGVCSNALPGGPCACVDPAPAIERVMCPAGECCADDECPAVGEQAGRCQGERLDPQNNACFGEPAINVCVAEACAADADCDPGKTCIRPGEYGHAISACVDATCATDADCVDGAEGQCTPFFSACFVRGFHCTYLIDACRTDADCPERGAPKVCLPLDGGGTECREVP